MRHEVEEVFVFTATQRNIEFFFRNRQGSGARTIVGGRQIKGDQNSHCTSRRRAVITICDIQANLAFKLFKKSLQDYNKSEVAGETEELN